MRTENVSDRIRRVARALDQCEKDASLTSETIALLKADLEDRRRSLAQADEAEERLKLATDAAGVGVWDWDLTTGAITWNGHHARIFGLDPDTFDGTYDAFRDRVHPDDREKVSAWVSDSVRNGCLYDHKYRVVCPGGEIRWVASKGKVYYDDAGNAVRMIGTVVDVTSHVRAEEVERERAAFSELRESRSRLDLAIRGAALGTWDWNVATGEVVYDERWAAMLGYRVEDVEPHLRAWEERVHPSDLVRVKAVLSAHLAGTTDFYQSEHRVRAKSGEWVWVLDSGRVFKRAEDGTPLRAVGVHLDITSRKKAEEALAEREARLRLALDASATGIWQWDPKTGAVHWSDNVFTVLDLPPGWFDGTADSFDRLLHPDDRDALWAAVAQAIESRAVFDREFRIIHPRGETRWLANRGHAFYAPDGSPTTLIGTVTDITERKRGEAELRAAREEAESANRAKDHFLAVLAHELRTPLTPVLAMASVMATDPRLSADTHENAELIHRNVELAARLVDDLLDVTRISRGKMQLREAVLDVHEVVRHVIQSLSPDAESGSLTLTFDAAASAHHVRGDMTRLQQVFTNLVKNAIKFTPPGGTVAIETRDAGEGSVSVSVSDNGLGIEPHALPRIFDAFEQGGTDITRLFGGLGLGLSISKALVDLHGGTIHVHSDGRGKGAVFTVVLPVAEALVRRPDPPPAANRATPAECRILLLEDHLDTARALARLLSMEGHRVQTANTIAAAVAAMAAQPYDLLISDLQLPDGSGLDFMRQVRERFPVAGIALSGYGSATDVEQSLRAGFVEHLTKPVNIGQLNDAICRVRARQAGDVT